MTNSKIQMSNFGTIGAHQYTKKNVMLFPIQKGGFFARSRKTRGWAEAYIEYAAQPIPQFDAEIYPPSAGCEKGPFLDGNKLELS
jgi:hypothetical protein